MRTFALVTTILVAGVAQSADAAIITGLVKTGGDTAPPPPQIVVGGLVNGAQSYVDRTYTWQGVPTDLVGADYIITENDDKGVLGENYAVTIAGPALLHIFVDKRLGTVGDGTGQLEWLNNGSAGAVFSVSGEVILRDEFGADFSNDVWTAAVGSGTYNLGEQQGASMYGIAATAAPIPEPSTVAIWSLLGFIGVGGAAWRKRRKAA